MDEYFELLKEIRKHRPGFTPKERMGVNALKNLLKYYRNKDGCSGDNFLSGQSVIKSHKDELDDYFDKNKDNDLESQDPDDYTVTDSGNIELKESLLLEITRRQMVDKSKHQSDKSKERYKRRTHYQGNISLRDIDFSKFYTDDILVATAKVGDYYNTVAFQGVILRMRDLVKKSSKHVLTQQMIIKAVSSAIDDSDLLVNCNCPDACLHKDTKIKLLNGEVITVKEMKRRFDSGEKMWVYSTDENGDFKPGEVRDVWIPKKVNEMIKITLDNNEEIVTTIDHLYMCRDGSYKRADELKIGQSLMPLYFKNDACCNGYECVKINSSKQTIYNSVYKMVANSELQNEIEEAKLRSGENIIAIHHSDFNKANNYPENLKPMGKNEHWRYHANFISERRKNDKEFDEKLRNAARRHMKELNANPTPALIESRKKFLKKGNDYWKQEGRQEWLNNHNSVKQKEYWNNLSEEEYQRICKIHKDALANPDVRNKISSSQRKVWNSYSEENRKRRGLKNAQMLQENWNNMSLEEKEIRNKKVSDSHLKRWQQMSEDEKFIASKQIRELGHKPASDLCRKKAKESMMKYNNSFTPEERSLKGQRASLSFWYNPKNEEARKRKSESLRKTLEKKKFEREAMLSDKDKLKLKINEINKLETNNSLKAMLGKFKYSLFYLIDNDLPLTEENYEKYKRARDPHVKTYFDSFSDFLEYYQLKNYNHKIIKIEKLLLEKPEEVYDISVNKWNNFYVNAGVVLHNCYRFNYWQTKLGYKYGTPETRPSDKTNPGDLLGSCCKHLLAILSNKRWTTQIAIGITDYVDKQGVEELRKAMAYDKVELPSEIAKELGKKGAYTKMYNKQFKDQDEQAEEQEELELKGEE